MEKLLSDCNILQRNKNREQINNLISTDYWLVYLETNFFQTFHLIKWMKKTLPVFRPCRIQQCSNEYLQGKYAC